MLHEHRTYLEQVVLSATGLPDAASVLYHGASDAVGVTTSIRQAEVGHSRSSRTGNAWFIVAATAWSRQGSKGQHAPLGLDPV